MLSGITAVEVTTHPGRRIHDDLGDVSRGDSHLGDEHHELAGCCPHFL
jgi:hypothetical protein